jgi:5-methylthioadenosine/S-adenosylhomocysteine deaminase
MAAEDTLTEEEMHWSISLAMCEMIRGGVTTFADMFHWTEGLIDTVVAAGMRVAAAPVIFGPEIQAYRAAGGIPHTRQIAHVEQLAERFRDEPLVRVMYGPHAVYTCGEDGFADVARRAAETGLGIHVHLSETAVEVQNALAANGRTPIESAAAAGLLTPRTIIAHAVKPTDRDIELLAASGATVVHNPQSNLKLGSGIAPVRRYLDAGIPVALGTDGAASNDSLDLLRDLKLAMSLARGTAESSAAWDLPSALGTASSVGSRALGFPVAELRDGDTADFVVLDAVGPHAQPMHSATAFVGWVATARDVTDVVVAGKPLLLDGELQTLDEERILFELGRIAQRLGISG